MGQSPVTSALHGGDGILSMSGLARRCFSAVLVSNPSLAVDAALVAPEGTWMHAAGDMCAREGLVDGRVRVVGTMDGFPEAQVLGAGAVDFMAFSPEGDVLGVVDKHAVSFWDTVTGARTLAVGLPEDRTWVTGMQFSPDGAMLAVWGVVGLYLVDCVAGRLLPLTGEGVNVHDARFVNEGRTVGAVAEQGYRQWGVPSGEELAVPAGPLAEVAAGDEIKLALVGGGGTWVAAKQSDRNVRVFDVQSGQLRAELEGTAAAGRIEACADGSAFTVAVVDKVLVWDAKAGKQCGLLEGKLLLVSPDGATIATYSQKNAIFYDARSLLERENTRLADESPMYYSPHGACLVTAKRIRGGMELRLRDVATGNVVVVFQTNYDFRGVQIDPTGGTLGYSTSTATSLWDMSALLAQQGDSPYIVGGNVADATREAYKGWLSPDGGVLVVQSKDESTARVVDARTGARICKVDVGGVVMRVAVSLDGKKGAFVFQKRDLGWALVVWDMATGEVLASTELPGADRWYGRHLSFAGEDKLYLLNGRAIYAWSPSSGEPVKVLREPVDFLSPDEERLWVWEEGNLVQEDVAGQARRVLPTRCVDDNGRAWEVANFGMSQDRAWGVVAVAVRDPNQDQDDGSEGAVKYNLCAFEVGGTRSAVVPAMLSKVPVWLAITCDGGILACRIVHNSATGSSDLCAWDMHATPPALLCKISMTPLRLVVTADDILCWSYAATVNFAAAVVVRLPSYVLRELGVDGSTEGSALARELRGKMMVADAACVSKECVVVTVD